ncbi:S9 family peptidase [Robiginitalea sp. M366]|uniref:S9 family peptidase n=1 Tax=Robiginitalea aestuariiviva TaxID=3036903 RepID=UPI00240E8C2E|nr:S9 family peptidase [Robiginitalea aestuariiviva]MDG1573041.1 S9 family peptidase [Robiginitalea aestuariiviva]
MTEKRQPPRAEKRPHTLECHGDVRTDNYFWLNQREDPGVLAYLEAENDYYKACTAHTAAFQQELFEEMKGRIKEDDQSVPYRYQGYWYITRYATGMEYPIYTRHKEYLEAPEEIMFNANTMAEGHAYFNLRGISVSPDNRLAAFGVDTVSRRQYTIRIKNLETGECYPEALENTTGSSVWAADNKTLFYTRKDPQTLRSDRIYKHVLGTPVSEDVLVYQEEDPTFNTYVYKSKSQQYVIIGAFSTLTSEYRILPANQPEAEFRVFSPRERGVEYSIYHYDGTFYILTNKDGATNFKVMKTPEHQTESRYWQEFIPHRKSVLLEDLEIFREYYVVCERDNGLNRLQINRWDGAGSYYIPFESETYVAYPYINLDYDTTTLRMVYNAMTTPYSIVDYDMQSREWKVVKEQEVLGGTFHKENYRSQRVWAPAADGTRIPISLVYHKDTPLDGSSPLLQYGYGAYGSTTDPYFSTVRLSLLDRGFIYAIAHIRGGEYLGRPWYEAGRLQHKMNSFTDFIDCSRFLIASRYTSAAHLYAYGGSAGGLLMGAVVNLAPELYHGIVAAVPFVDVVTTMLDDTIPLTTGEYDEWGNPSDPEAYACMLSYSPYDNVKAQAYPHMLVTTGLHDSQVQYWEPAKWVAKLRDIKRDENLLYLYTNLDAGHGGASGRFEALKETAMEYAFLLDLEGKTPRSEKK